MNVKILRNKNEIELGLVEEELKLYIKDNKIDISFCNDMVDIYILMADNIYDFLEYYNSVEEKHKSNIILLTNNIDSSYILMALKFIDNITYMKLTIKYLENSLEYKKYKIKSLKRIIRNIFGFAAQKDIYI